MYAQKLKCDAMHILKCATSDAVLANICDLENMASGQLRKVLAPLILKQEKVIRRKEKDLLIKYCQLVHVEKRERKVIDGEEQHLKAGNSLDCDEKSISDDATDEWIATDINAGDLKYFFRMLQVD